jgi:hypothetical protein
VNNLLEDFKMLKTKKHHNKDNNNNKLRLEEPDLLLPLLVRQDRLQNPQKEHQAVLQEIDRLDLIY